MRGPTLLVLLLLAGCAGGGNPRLDGAAPGVNVAEAALRGGSPQVALQVITGVLTREPGNVPAMLVQADALTALGRLDEAAPIYQAVLKSEPKSVEAHIGLGRLRLATDPAAAEALFLEALQRDPRNTTALNDLGVARDLLGRHEAAQAAYRQALGVNPDLNAAQVNLALSLAMDGDSGKAVQLLRPLAEDPGASRKLRHDLAAVLAMAGDQAEAERILSADLSPAEVRQALQAYAAARAAAPAAAPAAAAPMLLSGAAADPTGTDQRRSADSPAVRQAGHAEPAPPAHNAFQAQLASATSEQGARNEWARLQDKMPALLAGRQPMLIPAQNGGQTVWRVRVGGFGDAQQANAFCDGVRGAGGACLVFATDGTRL